jgi:small subunit ribosomal protein S9
VETKATPKAVKGRQFVWGTGRRKSSVARVRIADGTGIIKINDREVDNFFSEEQDRKAVTGPLDLVDARKSYDMFVNVVGGGHTGQAFAIRMGLARALVTAMPEKEAVLRDSGFLTRDSRMKERKKYGQRGARRGFQFSKR